MHLLLSFSHQGEAETTASLHLAQDHPWSPAPKTVLAGGLLAWLAAAYALDATGALTTENPQPFRPVLLAIQVPLGLFLAAVAGSARVRAVVLDLDLRLLTLLRLQRVVGFAFLPLAAYGVLPSRLAWPAWATSPSGWPRPSW